MIGKNTGKVIQYAVRSKKCRICDEAKARHEEVRAHDCRRNWSGSAKAMESDMVVDMVKDCNQKCAKVSTVVGDEDTSTIARLHREVDPSILKKSDNNHLKKILANDLYAAQKKHRQLSVKVIKYLQKCFAYTCANRIEETVKELRRD
ncbi:uncharacterized protein [Ptychodera flava]|uniref:uncharacterized protein n=1 Tax=Ptychodera flava TaxID=63121 RepID=UPI00396A7332